MKKKFVIKVTASAITVGPVDAMPDANGDAVAVAGSANRVGNCDTDNFSVTTPGGKAPPLICGTNTGGCLHTFSLRDI